MYENQTQDQCGPAQGIGYGSIRGREDEQQAKYAEHVKMERMHRDAQMNPVRGIGSGIKPPELRGTLESAIESVAHGTGEVFEALERLSERLHLVLQPEAPMPTGETGKALNQMPRSPAVNRLHQLREQLELLTSRMNSVRSRLDA